MKYPVIGIMGNLDMMKDEERFMGMYRAYISQDYVNLVKNNHAVPVILPVAEQYEQEMLAQTVERLDGILLSGGYDITPALYGEDAVEGQGPSMECVDRFYLKTLRLAEAYHKPVFGICKGMQMMNAAYGGTLYQDLPSQRENVLQHTQQAGYQEAVHRVCLEKDSFLGCSFEETRIRVNSHHHQAVKALAKGFRVTAVAPDGVIEAIESFEKNPMIGVQWHPEMMAAGGDIGQLKLFGRFLEYCK